MYKTLEMSEDEWKLIRKALVARLSWLNRQIERTSDHIVRIRKRSFYDVEEVHAWRRTLKALELEHHQLKQLIIEKGMP